VSARLAAALGYDPERVAELSPGQQRALALVALTSAPALGLFSGAAGYGLYLASDRVDLGVVGGVGAGLSLLNLLRLAVAGGGVGPQQPYARVTTWMPRTAPLVMLALLGVFFAQPLILAASAPEQDPAIDELRRALVAAHADAVLRPLADLREGGARAVEAAQARLDAARAALAKRQQELDGLTEGEPAGRTTLERAVAEDRRAVTELTAEVARQVAALASLREREAAAQAQDLEPFRRHLERSHFLLRRVQLTWERPLRPLLLSLAMVLLMVLPWAAAATLGREAARAYEAARWASTRALIEAAYVESRRLEAAALSGWATFTGLRLELHEDAPYGTRPRAGAGRFEARHG
jgi:hypothetical protein